MLSGPIATTIKELLAKEGKTIAQLGASAQTLSNLSGSKGKVKDSQRKARIAFLDQRNIWRREVDTNARVWKEIPAKKLEAACPIKVLDWPIKSGNINVRWMNSCRRYIN